MPASEAIPDLPQRIVTALDVEPEWTLEEPHGIGFVAGEVGVWLTVRDTRAWKSVLRLETRLARHVPDGPDTWRFCDRLNNHPQLGSLGGRWVHDPATETLALVADLSSFNQAGAAAGYVELYAGFLALMTSRTEFAAHTFIAQPEPAGGEALTLIAGRRRTTAHPILNRLAETRDAGQEPALVHTVADLVQRDLPGLLPARVGGRWLTAGREHGLDLWSLHGTVLSVDTVRNPELGWGIYVEAGLDEDSPEQETRTGDQVSGPRGLPPGSATWATLNREASARGGVAPGCWTKGGGQNTVHRFFLPAALLACATPAAAALFTGELAGLAVRQLHSALHGAPETQPVLAHPGWPGDEEADALVQRDA